MKNTSFLFLLFLSITVYAQEKIKYPIAKKFPTWDDYHGTIVEDPYRSMEQDSLPSTLNWVAAENELTEKYMANELFQYPIERQLKANSYYSYGTVDKSGKYFFDRIRQTASSSSSLYIKKTLREQYPDLVVDPIDYKISKGEIVSVRTFEMSGDNKYLAFALSRNGSDWMEIRVKEVYPFKKCPDVITGVKFSDIRWKGNGFFYCRYQSMNKDKPLTSVLVDPCLYYHKLGTVQEKDSLIFEYEGEDVMGSIDFDVLEDERFLILYHISQSGSKYLKQVSFWDYHDPTQKQFKTLLTHPSKEKKFFEVIGMLNNKFIVYSNLGAPFKRVLSFDPAIPNKAKELIAEYDAVLTQVQLINHKLVCLYLKDIESLCLTFDGTGKLLFSLTYPPGSSVEGFEGTNKDVSTLFYYYSFLHPPIAFEYDLRNFKTTLIEKTTVSYDVKDFEMKKVFYVSKDGQQIPMIIAGLKSVKHDGKAATVLYGYGGYGSSMTPFFDVGFMTHMRNGGLVALPCLRGGGEYGDEWHDQGKLKNKQTVFDDFIAAAEYLIANRYTSSQKLALMGGSNGGLLVGAVLTQRPDLFKVAICEVGVYDMLRYHEYTVGHYWIREYGVSEDSAQFEYLYKYSPLHNIKAGVKYPATFIITSDHDDRVVPMHSYKFAATLQEKTNGTDPILLYTQKNAGHYGSYGQKTNAYIYAFIYKNMGLKPWDVDPNY